MSKTFLFAVSLGFILAMGQLGAQAFTTLGANPVQSSDVTTIAGGDLPPDFRTIDKLRDWLPIRREQCGKGVRSRERGEGYELVHLPASHYSPCSKWCPSVQLRTFPITACSPSFTCTCSTRTT